MLKESTELIKPVTSDIELEELADLLNIKLDGIYGVNELDGPLSKKGSYMVLLQRKPDEVGHWVCLSDSHYFDSSGSPPPSILGDMKYNSKQYQGVSNGYCGIWCLLWLYCKQKNRMKLLDRFEDLNLTVL